MSQLPVKSTHFQCVADHVHPSQGIGDFQTVSSISSFIRLPYWIHKQGFWQHLPPLYIHSTLLPHTLMPPGGRALLPGARVCGAPNPGPAPSHRRGRRQPRPRNRDPQSRFQGA